MTVDPIAGRAVSAFKTDRAAIGEDAAGNDIRLFQHLVKLRLGQRAK